MVGQGDEKAESRVHRDHAFVRIRFLPIVLAGGTERQDNLVVALSPQRAALEQRLRVEQAPCVRVLTRLDVVQHVPAQREGLPEPVVEAVLGVCALLVM